ncbi:TorF family putative porin [Undibacterium sp. Xuan67W]|uniref:TorF family putative porin n=1 Tax=Undibacterium sp. Xuan67W TaxID=3413057 RepID=UPI003BF083E7
MYKIFLTVLFSSYLLLSTAYAQVSGSVAVVSDYLYRGISLSNNKPVPQVNLVYDDPQGWYLGGFASKVKINNQNNGEDQLLFYGGYSQRMESGVVWELGATNSLFPKVSNFNYAEIFAGITIDNLNARIYWSPDYIGQSVKTAYIEVNGDRQIRTYLDIFFHIGLLRSLSAATTYTAINRPDARIGFGTNFAAWKLQLAWNITGKNSSRNSSYGNQAHTNFVINANYLF